MSRSSSRSDPAAPASGTPWLWLTVIAAVVLGSVWIRWPGFSQGGFASHDVAGILYNAMVLHDGGLPYVDTLEMKAPGTFYLAAAMAGPQGRDIARFQVWANLWALGTLVLVARLGWQMFGPRAAAAAAVLYGLHDAVLDSMDANYVTWAQLPMIAGLGAVWTVVRQRVGQPLRAHRRTLLVAGVLLGLAALLKRPAGAGLLAAVAVVAWPDGTARVARLWRVGWLGLGAVCAHVPMAIHYASHGALWALWSGYVFNDVGGRYVAQGAQWLGAGTIVEPGLAAAFFVGLPLCAAAFAARAPTPADRPAVRLCWIWFAATALAASLGLRFFKGYFLAVLPPLCLLGAAPWGLLGARRPVQGLVAAVAFVPLLLLGARQATIIAATRIDRARAHDRGGRTIAAHVSANADPDDTVWVWGWHLWDVYPLTGMRSGSRVYKSLGALTPATDNTWRRPPSPLRFTGGPAAAMLLDDLDRNRPAYIVLGSTVPRRQFTALREFLRAHYRRDHRVRLGRVEFWQRAATSP